MKSERKLLFVAGLVVAGYAAYKVWKKTAPLQLPAAQLPMLESGSSMMIAGGMGSYDYNEQQHQGPMN